MAKSFTAFMDKIIDYAGLFPPAKLPMESAIQNYIRYRSSRDAWMLSRFICPAARLKELYPYRENLFTQNPPIPFSVLGRSGKNQRDFLNGLRKDLAFINEFVEYNDQLVTVEIFETRLPADLFQRPEQNHVTKFLNTVSEEVEYAVSSPVKVFYEIPVDDNWKSAFPAAIKGLAEHNFQVLDSARYRFYQTAGFKLRCGGTEPELYPSPELVAYVLALCQRHLLPFKATAGLHHPIRHFNETEKVKMHGFLNVFGAGILADAHQLEYEQILEIVADEDPSNFLFTRNAFAWRNLRASIDEIKKAREERLLSFGSCSFDEPRDDLRKLKLL